MDNPNDFMEYLSSVVKLDSLEKLTDDMDKDLEESQKLLDEIKSAFDRIPSQSKVTADNGLRHEDISSFLDAAPSQLLLPDMSDSLGVDLDETILRIKSYAEELKKSYIAPEPKIASQSKETNNLDLDQYSFCLDQLGKRLANIKLTKKEEVNNKNPELEGKLTMLCDDVNNFTQMVQAKTKLTECNKSWLEAKEESHSLQYNDAITKLLSGVNEVVYLLQNRN